MPYRGAPDTGLKIDISSSLGIVKRAIFGPNDIAQEQVVARIPHQVGHRSSMLEANSRIFCFDAAGYLKPGVRAAPSSPAARTELLRAPPQSRLFPPLYP